MTWWQKYPLYLLLSCSMLPIAGCEDAQERAARLKTEASITQDNFQHPGVVGTLPDGRKVYVVVVKHLYYDHYVYYTDDLGTFTDNHQVQNGKTTRTDVQVMINAEQDPSVVEAKQRVIAKARLEQATKALEEAKKNAQEAGVPN